MHERKKAILLTKAPTGYIQINSGLGEKLPFSIIVVPMILEKEIIGVISVLRLSYLLN